MNGPQGRSSVDGMDRTLRDWYRANKLAGDAVVAGCVFLVAAMFSYLARPYDSGWSIGLTLLLSAPLVLRRSEPEAMFVLTAVICFGQLAGGQSPMLADVVVLIVIHAVSAYSTTVWRYAALLT